MIAIDDISVVEGECADVNMCTFEEDLCSWINAPNGVFDQYDWLRNSGATPSFGTGPSVDHTFGTPEGYYLYFEASDGFRRNETAWLISEHYNSGPHCLVFWYHMYGADIGSLNVYTRVGTAKPQLEWR